MYLLLAEIAALLYRPCVSHLAGFVVGLLFVVNALSDIRGDLKNCTLLHTVPERWGMTKKERNDFSHCLVTCWSKTNIV